MPRGAAGRGTGICGRRVATGVPLFGSRVRVMPEKAVVANSSAVREWDSNGTNFGYNPARGATRGEFGHNDFYPVAVAAAQLRGLDGRQTLRAMILLDEIRGRLAEVFALKNYKIDHVVHGAIASAADVRRGAGRDGRADRIGHRPGRGPLHSVSRDPRRQAAFRFQGASAAISAEVAVLSMRRAMRGFVGPADIFRNPEAIFCLFEKPAKNGHEPLRSGAGDQRRRLRRHGHALQAGPVRASVGRRDPGPDRPAGRASAAARRSRSKLKSMRITIYEPAFGIIGDPAKRDPRTRQSADHSMVYIIATLLRKAFQRTHRPAGAS